MIALFVWSLLWLRFLHLILKNDLEIFSLDSFFVISLNKTLLEAKKMRHQTKKIRKLEMYKPTEHQLLPMLTSFDIDITWSPLTKIIVYQFLMLATGTEIKGRSPQLSVSTLYIDVDRKLQRTGLFVSVLVCLWHHLQRDLLVEKKKKIPRSLKETKKCFNFIIPKVKSNLPNSCLYSFFFAWLVFFFFVIDNLQKGQLGIK